MTVFKTCIKILKVNWFILAIYFIIFTLMSFSLSTSAKENAEKTFEKTDVKISVINNDDSEYADSLVNYIDNNAKLIEIVESDEGISDALFYRYTEYVVKIDKGFGDKMASGEEISLDKYEVTGSYSGIFADTMINEYIAKMRLYGPDVPESAETEVSMLDGDKEESATIYMFNFSAYSLMAIIILGVGAIISTFSREDIRKRNLVSPVSIVRIGLAQLMSSLVFVIIVWVLMLAVCYVVIRGEHFGMPEILMSVNMLLYSLVCLAMGFCISSLIMSVNGRTIAANVVALGFSFIGGVMVSSDIMSDTVKVIGSFTPTYWFTEANRILSGTNSLSFNSLEGVWKSAGIQVLFIVAFLAIGLASLKKKSGQQ